MGIGASMLGMRPVMELMFWSFAYVAWDQIVNNAACVRYMSGGLINCPHRHPRSGQRRHQCRRHPFAHAGEFPRQHPGLKVVCPATAYDAKGLLKIRHPRQRPGLCSWRTPCSTARPGKCPEEEYSIPLGRADLKREGTDISLIAHGRAVITCLKAAEILEAEHGIDAEVLDLRSIRPLDEDAILASVRKTHRAVLRGGKQTLLRRRRPDRLHSPGEGIR